MATHPVPVTLDTLAAMLAAQQERLDALSRENQELRAAITPSMLSVTTTPPMMADNEPAPTSALERLSRRWVLRRGLQAAAASAELLAIGTQHDAEAAPLTDDWHLGGNPGVATDGTNFLGTTTIAPLIFKTAVTANTPLERMRITSAGKVGIGVTAPTAKLEVTSTGTTILGRHTGTSGSTPGVYGETSATVANASGVQGVVTATAPGVDAAGVLGQNRGTAYNGVGVRGRSEFGYGVQGTSVESYGVVGEGYLYGIYGSGRYYGVEGYTSNVAGIGVIGTAPDNVATAPDAIGVYANGTTGVHGNTSDGTDVRGVCRADGYTAKGVHGLAEGTNAIGVLGEANTGTSAFGIWGRSTNGYAGVFSGKVYVSGTLTKGGGAFKIDHPLAPESKYLSHSFVESPDMLNIYNGNVTLDANGSAIVQLPAYFAALNRDVRYQLTPIGSAAVLYVAAKVRDNRFTIAGGTPGLEVSWQVTGIRQDAFANANRILVEEDKPAEERGTYLHPAAHGKPESASVDAKRVQQLDALNALPGRTPPTLPRPAATDQ